MRRYLVVITTLALAACGKKTETPDTLKTGMWRATIEIQGQQLPFNFELTKDNDGGYDIYIRNADERLLLDEVNVTGDSVNIGLHIFDANIKAAIKGDTLQGEFIKNYEKDFNIPFTVVYGQTFRFEKVKDQKDVPDFSGKYAVTFTHEFDTTVRETSSRPYS